VQVGDHIIDGGRVRVVRALGQMAFERVRIQSVYTRPALDEEVTEDDREAIAAGRRVTRVMREAARR